MDTKNILITGSAGFIGYFLARRLLDEGLRVTGIDNLNDYYDPSLKQHRLNLLKERGGYTHHDVDIADRSSVEALFKNEGFDIVVNLAAQAGVRYSLKAPHSYVNTNVVGFLNMLEGCRHTGVEHFIFASSSSVYGANTKMPFSVHDNVDHPVSLYAATKKANELMAHSYSHLYGLNCTGLRFFTVYGPMGRPDMAYFLFTRAVLAGEPIKIFNHGNMKRDFTYIDDIIEGVFRILNRLPTPDSGWDGANPDPGSSYAPYRIYNIGNNHQVDLMHFIEVLEDSIGKKAKKVFWPLQPGDVPETYANIDALVNAIDYKPATPIETGLPRFVEWYRSYYKV